MYTLFFLRGIAPFVGGLCLENFITRQGDLCNVRDYPPNMVKYEKPTVTGSVVPVSVLAFAVTVAEEPKATDVPFISTDELTS